MDIVTDISLYSENKGLIKEKYKDENIDIKSLSKELASDEVAEDIDTYIEATISCVLELKKRLKTPQKINKYIQAYIFETDEILIKERILKNESRAKPNQE